MFRSCSPELEVTKLFKPALELKVMVQCSSSLLPESLPLLIVLNVTLEKTLIHHGFMKPYSSHISFLNG